jgi:hypothetical protein
MGGGDFKYSQEQNSFCLNYFYGPYLEPNESSPHPHHHTPLGTISHQQLGLLLFITWLTILFTIISITPSAGSFAVNYGKKIHTQ